MYFLSSIDGFGMKDKRDGLGYGEHVRCEAVEDQRKIGDWGLAWWSRGCFALICTWIALVAVRLSFLNWSARFCTCWKRNGGLALACW